MSYEMIALMMFSSLMLLLFTGQRVFAAIGFVGAASSMMLWGVGGVDIAFASAIKLMKWYPLADVAHVHLHGLRVVGEQDCR
jgi:hypothetical protein